MKNTVNWLEFNTFHSFTTVNQKESQRTVFLSVLIYVKNVDHFICDLLGAIIGKFIAC